MRINNVNINFSEIKRSVQEANKDRDIMIPSQPTLDLRKLKDNWFVRSSLRRHSLKKKER